MSKNIMLRNIPDHVYEQLKKISKEYQYSSFNQFLLDQIQKVVVNDGLNYYDNHFADTLTTIKEQQQVIMEALVKEDIREAAILANLDITENLVSDWLTFIDDTAALEAERKAGG